MDKSDLLDEWDVVTVSSVYEAERENAAGVTKNDVDAVKDDKDSSVDNNASKTTDSVQAEPEATIEAESKAFESQSDVVIEPKIDTEVESNIELEPKINIKNEPEINLEHNSEANIAAEPENIAAKPENIAAEPENIIAKPENITAEPENITAEPEISSVEPGISSAEPENSAAASESVSVISAQTHNNGETQSGGIAITGVTEDTEIRHGRNSDVYTEEKVNIDTDHGIDVPEQSTDDENIGEDIVHIDHPVNTNFDSSAMSFETESTEDFDGQDAPEIVPERIKIEQEMASIESSSSDIDIIDENIEESITSSFISPLSLSISSSVADTPSMHSFSSQSEEIHFLDRRPEERIEDIGRKKDTKRSESTEKTEPKYNVRPERQSHEERSENVHSRKKESQRTTNRRSFFDWFALLIELFRNMSGYDWCLVGGIAMSIYLTVVVNQTNIFAVVQKDTAMSQMKDMMDELKNDNKLLKEQMLSELKNDKVISSFEHQIRELRKENSKLNHMLYDVAKVLDKQKYSHEKKEAEYLVPYKKEINKLKEHINLLKFDNEELQNQLVRMRYGSFAQGGTDATEPSDHSKTKETGGQKTADTSREEIPLDYESLKKWNELISLLTEELGSFARGEGLKEENSNSDTKNKNPEPFWKALFSDAKGALNNLKKLNFTTVFSHYKKANEKAVSDIYKFVKDFFTVAEHTEKYTSNVDDSQWKNIGDFIKDLKGKWYNIKDRLYTTDLKKFFEKNFKQATSESSKAESFSQKSGDAAYDQTERTSNVHFKSEKKHDKEQTAEETKWMFNRAAHREELRNTDEEEDVNWFLKKGKENTENEKKHY